MTQQRSLFAVWLSWQRLTAWPGKPRMVTAWQGEHPSSPAPPVEPRSGRVRPSFTVSNLCYISVLSFVLYVKSRNCGGDPEPREDALSLAQDPSAPLPFDAGDSAPNVLPRLEGVKVGYKQKVNLVPNKIHVMKTLSLKPPIFEIPEFLSEDECKLLIHWAEHEGLKKSYTKFSTFDANFWDIHGMDQVDIFNYQDRNKDGKLQAIEVMSFEPFSKGLWLTPEDIQEMYAALKADPDGNGVLSLDEFKEVNMQDYFNYMAKKKANMSDFVRNSQQTWLDQGKGAHPVIHSIQQRMIHLTELSTEIVECSEYLQVVRYDQGGYYHAHLDSTRVIPGIGCSHTAVFGSSPLHSSCRYATILLYLNNVTGGGETTFPIADNSTYDYVSLLQNNIDLRDTRRHCDKGNLRIKPVQGTAVLWYNFLPDEEGWAGDLDDYSLHGGCLVTEGIKWIANNWINVDPDRWRQLLVQKYTSIVDEDQCEGVLDKSCSDVCEEPP